MATSALKRGAGGTVADADAALAAAMQEEERGEEMEQEMENDPTASVFYVSVSAPFASLRGPHLPAFSRIGLPAGCS